MPDMPTEDPPEPGGSRRHVPLKRYPPSCGVRHQRERANTPTQRVSPSSADGPAARPPASVRPTLWRCGCRERSVRSPSDRTPPGPCRAACHLAGTTFASSRSRGHSACRARRREAAPVRPTSRPGPPETCGHRRARRRTTTRPSRPMSTAAAPGAAVRAKPAGAESSTLVSTASGGGGGSTEVPAPSSCSILLRPWSGWRRWCRRSCRRRTAPRCRWRRRGRSCRRRASPRPHALRPPADSTCVERSGVPW